jgi:glycosyltransferase involved in cell wall biosynthesis
LSQADTGIVELSVVVPFFNEAEAIEATLREIVERVRASGRRFEVLAVDDGSSDDTGALLQRLRGELPGLRVLTLVPHAGQSAAMCAGFRAARGGVIAALDGDGQNDPADIETVVAALSDCDACFGYRSRRHDSWSRRWGSRLANGVRNRMLGESIIDTGCSLKAFRAGFLQDLPCWYGVHRFLASYVAMRGARVKQVPVNHRPRRLGRSKYTNLGRLKTTVWDLFGVRWMKARHRDFEVREAAG